MSHPTEQELVTEPFARVAAHRIIGGPREGLPAWWAELLHGQDKHRLDIVLRGSVRVGITIDGVKAMDYVHDVLRYPDGRFEIFETESTLTPESFLNKPH